VLECVISLETFPFVERHYAELANVPSLALFLVNCANTALPSRILPLAMFTVLSFPQDMFPQITQKSPRKVHMRPTWSVSWWSWSHWICVRLGVCGLHLICSLAFCHLHQKFFLFQFWFNVDFYKPEMNWKGHNARFFVHFIVFLRRE
jgi:hypothetical protein